MGGGEKRYVQVVMMMDYGKTIAKYELSDRRRSCPIHTEEAWSDLYTAEGRATVDERLGGGDVSVLSF